MTTPSTRRPGMVTLIGVLVYIQAAMAAVAAIVTISLSVDTRVQDAVGLTTAGMVWSGIWEAVMAVLLALVAGGIMQGSRAFRFVVALVVGLRMVSAVALMMVYHTGGYLFNALIAALLGTLVLWALYGHQPSDDYFSQREQLSGPPA